MGLARQQTGVARADEQFVNHACRMLLEFPWVIGLERTNLGYPEST